MSDPPQSITREGFVEAAREYVSRFRPGPGEELNADVYAQGWEWDEGINAPFTSSLKRTLHVFALDDKSDGEEDLDLELSSGVQDVMDQGLVELRCNDRDSVAIEQYIVYSSTWRTPVLYFQAHKSNGSLLTIEQLILSGIMASGMNDVEVAPDAEFPRLGIGENPATGTMAYYLHPCQTQTTISSVLGNHQSDLKFASRYLEAFIMLCSTVIKMR